MGEHAANAASTVVDYGAFVMIAMAIIAMVKSHLEAREARLMKKDALAADVSQTELKSHLASCEKSQIELTAVITLLNARTEEAKLDRARVEKEAHDERVKLYDLIAEQKTLLAKLLTS